MRPFPLLPVPLLTLALTGCLPELPEEKPNEGNVAGDCTDRADNDDDGAFDCEDDGCAASPDCAVAPAPPEGLAVAVTPEQPGDDADLLCTITTEAVDPNGDAVTYTYAWSVDGADAGLPVASVGNALTVPGQAWTCTVTPSDGTLTGTPASATVSIERANAAPSAPVVAITPEAPNDDEGLRCAVVGESVDPDGDEVTYTWSWTVDGVDAGIAGESVDPARTSVGETWTCSVTASDGSATSASGSARVTVAAAPTCGDGSVTHTASGVDFVTVCAQTFEMGCTAGQTSCNSDEYPVASVTISRDFMVSRTEVTQDQFAAAMGYNPSGFPACGGDCPVEQVSWSMAAAYANAVSRAQGVDECYDCTGSGAATVCEGNQDPYNCAGYRLPTEAEWEGAARCGNEFRYAGSDDAADVAWFEGNTSSTEPVGGLAANACGIFDMSGNVAEFVHDWRGGTYTDVVDPFGPASGAEHGRRGGYWQAGVVGLRVSGRNWAWPTLVENLNGIRLARTVP